MDNNTEYYDITVEFRVAAPDIREAVELIDHDFHERCEAPVDFPTIERVDRVDTDV